MKICYKINVLKLHIYGCFLRSALTLHVEFCIVASWCNEYC